MSVKLFKNYLPELASVLTGRKFPKAVSLNITDRCNQSCVYCEIGKNIQSTKKDNLDFEDIRFIIDEMEKIGMRRLSINGGEPFLFESIIETIEYAASKKIICAVTSNGMTIHKLTDNDLDIIKKSKCEINISVDSMDEKVHCLTRGNNNATDNALRSAKKLIDKGIPLIFLTAISKYNYTDLADSLEKIYSFGVKQVLYQPIIYYSNYPDRDLLEDKAQLNVSPENIDILKSQLLQILRFERKHGIKTNVYRIIPWIEEYLKSASGSGSRWFWEKLVKKFTCRDISAIIDITYDGGIQPCAFAESHFSIKRNREVGLLNLWKMATKDIHNDIESGKYRAYCNGCCNHFSRNMLYSAIKYPIKNRTILLKLTSLIFLRATNSIYKKVFIR